MCFKSLWKLSLVTLVSLKLSGNEFQADGPATEKARRPYVCNRWRGRTGVVDWWTSWDAAEKRRQRLVGRGRPSTAAPDLAGNCAPWCRACTGTMSQCSSVCSNRNRPRSNLCVPVITRAAAFITRWSLSVVAFGTPARRALQYCSRSVTIQMWTSVALSLLTACRMNAGNTAAAAASRNQRRWHWRRVDQG